MKTKLAFALIAIAMFGLMFASGLVSAVFLPKSGVCTADSTLGAPFEAIRACDNNSGTQWISASAVYPHWLIVNLTGSWIVKNVTITTVNYAAATGHIDVWTGSSWVAYRNFTGGTINSNLTFQLDTPSIPTKAIRIFGLTGANLISPELMGAAEVWLQGNAVPVVPSCQLGTIGKTLDNIIPIIIAASLISFVFGFLVLGSDRGKKGSMDINLVIFIIGLVIVIGVSAAVIASMKVC